MNALSDLIYCQRTGNFPPTDCRAKWRSHKFSFGGGSGNGTFAAAGFDSCGNTPLPSDRRERPPPLFAISMLYHAGRKADGKGISVYRIVPAAA